MEYSHMFSSELRKFFISTVKTLSLVSIIAASGFVGYKQAQYTQPDIDGKVAEIAVSSCSSRGGLTSFTYVTQKVTNKQKVTAKCNYESIEPETSVVVIKYVNVVQ